LEKLNKPNQIKEFTLKPGETEKKTLLFIVPLIILFSLPFLIFHNNVFYNIKNILIDNFLISLPVLIAGIIFHELLHGLTWAILSTKGFRSVGFGLSKSNFTPYCHCKVPIKLKYYIWGGIMPALVLGFLPLIVSWFTGNTAAFLFGLVYSLAAGSDILICWKLRKTNLNALVQDFPDKTGCYLVDE
jgi:hypothetical protein